MKKFCFTVDDNVRFFKEITERDYASIFEHPYLNMYKRLHDKYGLKIQLNLFYEMPSFNLTEMTDKYAKEWRENSDWLKLSFHSKLENPYPYQYSEYDEVYTDCQNVHNEILRFASPESLGKTTTVHCCRATDEGLRALKDIGVLGLLGLYGNESKPRSSYQSTESEDEAIRRGEVVYRDGIAYAGIDIILNIFPKEEILSQLGKLNGREFIKIMIHEQYFYPDYKYYQKDFEEKISAAFGFLTGNGYESIFFEEYLKN